MSAGPAVAALRAATAADHDRVDALFGRFDLADPGAYRTALEAHARALPAVERALASVEGLPAWRPRTEALRADLAELDAAWPGPLAFHLPADGAAAWGMLYVIEGSRLGGAMLARQVGAGLPCRYLGARHLPGEWRAMLMALEAAAEGPDWLARAAASGRATFALYERAASLPDGGGKRDPGSSPG